MILPHPKLQIEHRWEICIQEFKEKLKVLRLSVFVAIFKILLNVVSFSRLILVLI